MLYFKQNGHCDCMYSIWIHFCQKWVVYEILHRQKKQRAYFQKGKHQNKCRKIKSIFWRMLNKWARKMQIQMQLNQSVKSGSRRLLAIWRQSSLGLTMQNHKTTSQLNSLTSGLNCVLHPGHQLVMSDTKDADEVAKGEDLSKRVGEWLRDQLFKSTTKHFYPYPSRRLCYSERFFHLG